MTFQREKLYNKEEINTLAICVWCLRLGSAEPAAHPAADATAKMNRRAGGLLRSLEYSDNRSSLVFFCLNNCLNK